MIDSTRSWRASRLIAVDVEGNGDSPHELIELALVAIVDGTIEGCGRSWLVRPQRPVTRRVVAIHGITNEQLATCPRFEDVAVEVQALLEEFPIVGHRVQVDRHLTGIEGDRGFDLLGAHKSLNRERFYRKNLEMKTKVCKFDMTDAHFKTSNAQETSTAAQKNQHKATRGPCKLCKNPSPDPD